MLHRCSVWGALAVLTLCVSRCSNRLSSVNSAPEVPQLSSLSPAPYPSQPRSRVPTPCLSCADFVWIVSECALWCPMFSRCQAWDASGWLLTVATHSGSWGPGGSKPLVALGPDSACGLILYSLWTKNDLKDHKENKQGTDVWGHVWPAVQSTC